MTLTNAVYKEFRRGTLDMLLLKLLAEEERYGYELAAVLEERAGEALEISRGTIYPVLYRLEEDGLLESRWQPPEERGAPKKFYSVTEDGRSRLTEMTERWRTFSAAVANVLSSEGGTER